MRGEEEKRSRWNLLTGVERRDESYGGVLRKGDDEDEEDEGKERKCASVGFN